MAHVVCRSWPEAVIDLHPVVSAYQADEPIALRFHHASSLAARCSPFAQGCLIRQVWMLGLCCRAWLGLRL